MHLLVDVGNSGVKIASSNGLDMSGPLMRFEHGVTADALRASYPRQSVAGVWAASVAEQAVNEAIEAEITAAWSCAVHWLATDSQAHGVTCAYPEPTQLGVDRWLALVGARHTITGNVIVIDSGTATTIDALRDDGVHLGGVIVPGLRMMQQALTQHTARLPLVDTRSPAPFADNTAAGIAAGTSLGLVAMIEGICRRQQEILGGEVAYLLTGGAAPWIAAQSALPMRQIPDLVHRGIARYVTSS